MISDTTLDGYPNTILTLRQRIPHRPVRGRGQPPGQFQGLGQHGAEAYDDAAAGSGRPHGALLLTEADERRATGHRNSCRYIQRLLMQSGVPEQEAHTEAAAITWSGW